MRFTLAAFALIMSAAIARAGDCVPLSKVKADAKSAFEHAVMAELGGTALADCASPDKVKALWLANVPNVRIAEMGGDEARGFLAGLNALPPRSTFTGDYLVTVTLPNAPNVVIVTFNAGCAGITLAMRADMFNQILRGL